MAEWQKLLTVTVWFSIGLSVHGPGWTRALCVGLIVFEAGTRIGAWMKGRK